MGGMYEATDISNLSVAKSTKKKLKSVASATTNQDKHIEILENKVDSLELEVIALKKQLVVKPIDKNYKEMYEKILPELQDYWDTTHPF